MKLHVVGDSISIHYGPYLQGFLEGFMTYSRMGQEDVRADMDNPGGANGGDSSMVLAFLRERSALGGIDADLLLINCGLHDIKTDPRTGMRQIPIEDYRENLRAILAVVAGMRCQPVWVRTTPCDDAVHNQGSVPFNRYTADCIAYNAAADAVMAEAGVSSIDLHGFTSNLGSDLYCDHVHFHEGIREKQAAFIAGWVSSFIGIRERLPPDRFPAPRESTSGES